MKFDLYAETLYNELLKLYNTALDKEDWPYIPDTIGRYHTLYEHVVREHGDLNIPQKDKEALWVAAKKYYNKHYTKWIKEADKEWNTAQLLKVYKSYLVHRYLLDKLYIDNATLILRYEDGTPVKPLVLWAENHEEEYE